MKYPDYIKKIFLLKCENKVNLDKISQIDNALGSPSKSFKCIHVAGTNGKGSVSTKIAKGLELYGYRTGLFTSPHISSYRERISINGMMISEEEVVYFLDRIFPILKENHIRASFFDVTTLLAFLYFAHKKVQIAVLETGLGGRLDPTNIVTPILSIITSISFDHTEILGDSLQLIAEEKAGIIKPGVPIIIGPTVPRDLISQRAVDCQSELFIVDNAYELYIEENNAISKKALEFLGIPEPLVASALNTFPRCRFEKIVIDSVTVILDVAHNVDGINHLFKAIHLKHPHRRLRIVVGISKSKDLMSCLEILMQNGCHFYPVEAPNGRGFSALDIQKGLSPSSCFPSIDLAVKQAIHDAKNSGDLLVICGSFFIMNEARKALGIRDACDPL